MGYFFVICSIDIICPPRNPPFSVCEHTAASFCCDKEGATSTVRATATTATKGTTATTATTKNNSDDSDDSDDEKTPRLQTYQLMAVTGWTCRTH